MAAEGASWMQALCAKKLCTMDKVWRGWLVLSCAWTASLKVECSLRRWARGIPESTGKSSLPVGLRHPEMMRIVSFNETFHAALNVFNSMAAEGASWNQVIESNCTHRDRLCFVFLVAASFVYRCAFEISTCHSEIGAVRLAPVVRLSFLKL